MPTPIGLLENLCYIVSTRTSAEAQTSYTAQLLAKGSAVIGRKLCEESVETLIEAMRGTPATVAAESADLLYHLAVLWQAVGVRTEDVAAILAAREAQSGLAEKAGRVS